MQSGHQEIDALPWLYSKTGYFLSPAINSNKRISYRRNHSPAKAAYHHTKFFQKRLDVFSKFVQKIFVFVQNMNGSSARLQNSDSFFPFRPAEQFTKARVKHKPAYLQDEHDTNFPHCTKAYP